MTIKAFAKFIIEKFSKYRIFRVIPMIRLYYQGNESPTAFAQYQQRINELQRILLFWRYAPSKYRGGLFLNLLGFQVVRYLYFNLRYMLRAHDKVDVLPKGYLDSMSANGFVTWPNALTTSDIRFLSDFFEKYRNHAMNHFDDFSELLIANSQGLVCDKEDFRKVYELVKANCHFEDIGRSLTGKKLSINPYVAILHYKSAVGNKMQFDGQDTPHSDVFYPSFKVFFYLTDVVSGNGPFTYYKGSHVFSFRRASQEYRDSIKYFSGAKNDIKPVSGLGYVQQCGFSEQPLIGDAGTAVLFNVQGIHRRGDFLKDKDRERKVLLIDFRQVEAGIQRFAA